MLNWSFKMCCICIDCMIPSFVFEAIDREKPEKFRKLQEATRSAQALVDQLTSGKRSFRDHLHMNFYCTSEVLLKCSLSCLQSNNLHFSCNKSNKTCIISDLLIINADVHICGTFSSYFESLKLLAA